MPVADYIEYKAKKIAIDEDGYMLAEDEWDRELADHIASKYKLKLTEDHWWVIDFIRNYYHENEFLPNIRVVVNALRRAGFTEKAKDRYLFELFPKTPIRLACKIAGLHKPPPGFVCL